MRTLAAITTLIAILAGSTAFAQGRVDQKRPGPTQTAIAPSAGTILLVDRDRDVGRMERHRDNFGYMRPGHMYRFPDRSPRFDHGFRGPYYFHRGFEFYPYRPYYFHHPYYYRPYGYSYPRYFYPYGYYAPRYFYPYSYPYGLYYGYAYPWTFNFNFSW